MQAKVPETVALAQAVRSLGENLVALMELDKLNARRAREKFNALRHEGFTEQQALELIKTP